MNEILAISESVWRRILGMKVVYFLVICAIAEIAITNSYRYLMANQHRNLMVDLSLLLTTLGGLLCVLALAFDIPRELREGTATTLLAKPLGRTQYLIGKFLGIAITAVCVTTLITVGFCIVHKIYFEHIPTAAIQGHALAVIAVLPMAAIALFFSSLMNEAAASILTAISVWLLHSLPALDNIPALDKVPVLVGGILANMDLFNMRAESSWNFAISWSYLGMSLAYAVLYSIGLVCLTGIFFNQRDLK